MNNFGDTYYYNTTTTQYEYPINTEDNQYTFTGGITEEDFSSTLELVSAESSEKNVQLDEDDNKDFNKDVIVYIIGNELSGNGNRIDNDNFNITRKYYDGQDLRIDTGNDISNNQISYSFSNTSCLIIDPLLNTVNESNLFVGQNNSIKKLTTNIVTKTIEGSFNK